MTLENLCPFFDKCPHASQDVHLCQYYHEICGMYCWYVENELGTRPLRDFGVGMQIYKNKHNSEE